MSLNCIRAKFHNDIRGFVGIEEAVSKLDGQTVLERNRIYFWEPTYIMLSAMLLSVDIVLW